MNDFDFDCMEKKRIARGDRYRRRGSRSRKCSLSTDHMTQKQWRERNGSIVSVRMDQPLSWENFKSLSKDLQEEYINSLMERFSANSQSLAEMFGISSCTVRRYIQENHLGVTFRVGHSMSGEQRRAWENFLRPPAEEKGEMDMPAATQEAPPDNESEQTNTDKASMRMTHFSIRFSGRIDPLMISNSLVSILGDHADGEVEVICNLRAE